MAQKKHVQLAKGDLLAAWKILENLAVSLDQMGGAFAEEKGRGNGAARRRRLHEALANYFTSELVKTINDARMRLGQYIPEAEAEAVSTQIGYWDYASPTRARRQGQSRKTKSVTSNRSAGSSSSPIAHGRK